MPVDEPDIREKCAGNGGKREGNTRFHGVKKERSKGGRGYMGDYYQSVQIRYEFGA
jgi:hypothetical protein